MKITRKKVVEVLAESRVKYEDQLETFGCKRDRHEGLNEEMYREYKELHYGALLGRAEVANITLELGLSDEVQARVRELQK